jgi:hypothetical protein
MKAHGRTDGWTHGRTGTPKALMLVAALVLAAAPGRAQDVTAPAPVAASPHLRFTVGVVGRYVEHRVDAGNGVELSSGTLFGGQGVLSIGSHVEIGGGGASGSLTADSASADDATLTGASGYLAVLPVPWLAVRAGGAIQTFSTAFAVQRWTSLRLGGEGRLQLTGGKVIGIVRFEIYPVVSVSGLTKPSRGFGAASGLSFHSGLVTALLLYEFERYDFPRVSGVARREQLGALTVGLGLGVGR